MSAEELPAVTIPPRRRWPRILGILAVGILVAAILSAWWIKSNLYASPFTPTKLSETEQQALTAKLDRLERNIQGGRKPLPAGPAKTKSEARLAPQPYAEDAAKRELRITERELNALIAKDEEMAQRVAIALSDDLVSVTLAIPMDEEVPILGGKTLRLNCGITLRHAAGKPVVAVRGVSIGGVPLPSAWLGDIKNLDLVREFGGDGGFWDLFSKGVEDIKVSHGSLYVKLKE